MSCRPWSERVSIALSRFRASSRHSSADSYRISLPFVSPVACKHTAPLSRFRWLPALCIKQVKEETDESSRTTAGFKAAKPSIECGCRGNAVVVGAVRDKGESCAHLLPCETNGTACSACEADPNAASEPDAKRAKPEFDAGADEPVCAERTSEAQQVVGSNPARSNGGETPEASPQGQALNLQLFFDLPPSCYATSLLRELSMGGVA